MTWILIVGVAVAVFAAMVWLLKLPRNGWEWAGAALLLGLAGYALQGSPGQPGAPRPPVENPGTADAALIAQRQTMGSAFGSGQSWLIVADGLSRQGQYGAAAQVLRTGVHQNPKDADLWVALGNALVGHGDGFISPAAQFAFQRAATISPTHPGPPFFMGLALAQSGRLAEARVIWDRLLEQAPKEASYRADLESRLVRLDAMIGEQAGAAALSAGTVTGSGPGPAPGSAIAPPPPTPAAAPKALGPSPVPPTP